MNRVIADLGRPKPRPGPSRVSGAARVLALSVAMAASPAGAQEAPDDPWFPDVRYFLAPAADPREPQFAAGLLWTDLFEGPLRLRSSLQSEAVKPAGRELHGTAAVGGTLPVWAARPWTDGVVVLVLQAGIFGRFRLRTAGAQWQAARRRARRVPLTTGPPAMGPRGSVATRP